MFRIGPDLIETCEDEPSAGPPCPSCGREQEWEECDCEDGYVGHDCGEDTCCCLDPEPNEKCGTCGGDGGYWVCTNPVHFQEQTK